MTEIDVRRRPGKDPDAPRDFAYVAVNGRGERLKSKMTAPSAGHVVAALQSEGWIPIDIKASQEISWNVDLTAVITGGGVKLNLAQRADFARRLHQLLKAGIAVPKALAALGEDSSAAVEQMCEEISTKVSAGVPMSQAMAEHPRAFDAIFLAYLEAGEESGTLVETTHRLSVMLAKRSSLALKIKSVTQYPKYVSYAIGVLVVGIIALLVPRFADIYSGFGAPLPAPTQMLVDFSHKFVPVKLGMEPLPFGLMPGTDFPRVHLYPFAYGSILAYIVGAALLFLRQTRDNIEVGVWLDKVRFRMPILGKLNAKMSLYRWASTLAGALATSVPTTRAIELAAAASGSRWQLSVAPELTSAVRTGRTIGETLAEHPDLYPANVRTMVTTGEQVGELAEMLDNVSNTLDDEIDALVAGLGAKIEVALLLFMGVVVGALLMVLYLPILNLATTAQTGLSGG